MEIKSYKKKNGETAYRFRIYVGIFDGKEKYIKRSGFHSKSEARQAIFELQQELQAENKNNPKLSERCTKNGSKSTKLTLLNQQR